MKTTDWTTCPICANNVAVNPRTLCIRQHRIGGQKSDVCDGSHRLAVRPVNLNPTDYTVYVDKKPYLSTADEELARKVARSVKGRVFDEWRSDVIEAFSLPSTPSPRYMWLYLTRDAMQTWGHRSAARFVRSRTCPQLVMINLERADALATLRLAEPSLAVRGEIYAEELRAALKVIEHPRRYTPPPTWEIDAHLASALISASQMNTEADLSPYVWALLTTQRMPAVPQELHKHLFALLNSAEKELLRNKPPHLRAPLMTLIDIQDVAKGLYHAR